jgi:hypothetical protein
MSLRFPYQPIRVQNPVLPLGGRTVRPRPSIPVTLIGPLGTAPQDALLDTGADDTVFPDRWAAAIGVDLTNAPQGQGGGVTAGPTVLRYAQVTLRITDGRERRAWQAWVSFAALHPRSHPLLGYTGFLQFFTASFFGDRQEVELTVNGLYPGI